MKCFYLTSGEGVEWRKRGRVGKFLCQVVPLCFCCQYVLSWIYQSCIWMSFSQSHIYDLLLWWAVFFRASLSQSMALFQLPFPLFLPFSFPSPPYPFPLSPSLSQSSPLKTSWRGKWSAVGSPIEVWGSRQSPSRCHILLQCNMAKRVWLQHLYLCLQHNLNVKVVREF